MQRLSSPLIDTLENKIDEILYLKITSEENFYEHVNTIEIFNNLQHHYGTQISLRIKDIEILVNNKSPIILNWYQDIILHSWCQLPKKIELLCSLIEPKNIKKVKHNSIYEMRNTIYHSAYFLNYIIEEKNSISDINILYNYVCEQVSFGTDEKEYIKQNTSFCTTKIEYYLNELQANILDLEKQNFKKVLINRPILDYFVYENNCVIKSDYFKHFNVQNTKNTPFLNRNK